MAASIVQVPVPQDVTKGTGLHNLMLKNSKVVVPLLLFSSFSACCCLALSSLSIIKLVWLVELEFPLAPRPSPSAPRGRWHAQGSTGSQKKVLSVRRVFAGVASGTESGPVPVSVLWLLVSAPLLLEQRVPLGPLLFPALRTARVRQARQMCAQKQVYADWLNGDFL